MSNKLSLLVNFIGVDKMSGALRNIIGLGNKGSASLGALRGEGRKLEAQLREVRKQMQGASGNITELANRERQLESAIRRNKAALEERRGELERQSVMNEQLAMADELQQRGQDNMVAGAAIAAPLIFAARSAMKYEHQLALLAQKTDLSAEGTQNLSRELERIAQVNKQLPENILGGADFLASQGIKGGNLIGLVDQASRFATAFDVDVVDASKAAHASFLSLKVPINEVAQALEIMGVAGLEGGFEVRDMAQHFPALTSQFATLGADGLDAVASLSSALQVLQARTGDGAVAANQLDNLMGFVKTKQGQDNFKKFGINVVDELKKAEAEGGDALERLVQLTNQATGGDSTKIAEIFTDKEAGRGVLALVNGIGDYKKMRDAAFRAQGVTAEEFARMSKTSTANWTALQTSLSILSTTIGTHLLPLATRFMNVAGSVINSVSAWAQRNPALASTLLNIVASLAGLRIGLGAVQFLLGGVMKPFAMMTPMVLKYAGSWKNAFAMMRFGVVQLGLGMLRAGAMMLTNPIVLIITAIVAAVAFAGYMIYTHWDTIKAAFQSGWNYVTTLLSGAAKWLTNIGKMMMNGLLLAINPMALGARLIAMAKNGIAAFKSYLGIKSPSRVFMGLGEDTAAGMAVGLQRGERGVLGAAGRMATGMVAASSLAAAPVAAASATGAPAGGGLTVTINIQQLPGQDATALAEEVRRQLERMAGQAARSSYSDA